MDVAAVKAAVFRAYEMVPEAYRQKFCRLKKEGSQTCVEFVREKASLFDHWCAFNKVVDFEQLNS